MQGVAGHHSLSCSANHAVDPIGVRASAMNDIDDRAHEDLSLGGYAHPHAHGVSAASDGRWLALALAINVAFMAVEIAGGILASSLALISDAAHMLTDAGAIGLAIVALRLAHRAPRGAFTFGFKRAEILSAQLNGALLLVLAAIIAFEAIGRLASPPGVDGGLVLVVGLSGAGANGAAAWALGRADRGSLNIRGAFLHNLFDLAASLGAALAGLLVLVAGWDVADPIVALAVSLLMVHGGWGLIRDSGRVLLEAAPVGLDPELIGAAMAGVPGVVEVHDLHVWEITSGFPALAAHVLVQPGEDCHARRRELAQFLGERFGISHSTLQVEHTRPPNSELLEIGARPEDADAESP